VERILYKEYKENLFTREGGAFIIHSGNDRIGGIVIQVISSEVNDKGYHPSIFLDFGALMDISGRHFGRYDNLSYHSGLRPLIELGILPPIPNLYRYDIPNQPNTIEEWKKILNGRKDDVINFQQRIPIEILGILGTHFHWDHIGNVGFVNEKIPLITNEITYRVIQAMEKHWGADWRREITFYRDRNGGKIKGSFPIVNRRFINIINGVQMDIFPFQVTFLDVSHSAIGSSAVDVVLPSGLRIHYTGDIRGGSLTDSYLEWLKKQSWFDVFLIDGTNIRANKSKITEEDVAEKIFERLKNNKGTCFIMISPRHFERLSNIIEATKKTGRRIYLPLVCGFYLSQVQDLRKADERIPDLYDDDIFIYLHPANSGKYQASDYPKEMREFAFSPDSRIKRLNFKELERLKSEDGVVVLTSLNQLLNFFSHGLFPPNGFYIHSSSDAYDEKGRIDLGQIKRILSRVGYRFEHIHASGHFTAEELVNIARQISDKVGLFVPIHTNYPIDFSNLLKTSGTSGTTKVMSKIYRGYPYNFYGRRLI
jgi:mRNA degradation ribonuclease J1/J2